MSKILIQPSNLAGSATNPQNPIWLISNTSKLMSISLVNATIPLVSKPTPRSWQKLIIAVPSCNLTDTQQVLVPDDMLEALHMHDYSWQSKPVKVQILDNYESVPIARSVIVAVDPIQYKTVPDHVHNSEIRQRFESCLVTRGIGSVLGLCPYTQGRIDETSELVLVPRPTNLPPNELRPEPEYKLGPMSLTLQLWRACVTQQFDGTIPMDLNEMHTNVKVSLSYPEPAFNTLTISPETCLAFGKGILKPDSLVSIQTQTQTRTLKLSIGAIGSEVLVSPTTAFNLQMNLPNTSVTIRPTLCKQLPVANQVRLALIWEPDMDKSYVLDACTKHLHLWVYSCPVVAVNDCFPVRLTDKELLLAQMARHSCVSLIDVPNTLDLDQRTSIKTVWFSVTHIDPTKPELDVPSLATGEYAVDSTTQLVHEGSPVLAVIPPTLPFPPLPSISSHPLIKLLEALATVQDPAVPILIHGVAGSGKRTLVQTAVQSAGLTLVKVDVSAWSKDPQTLMNNIRSWMKTFASRKQLVERARNLVLVLEHLDAWCKGTNSSSLTCMMSKLIQQSGPQFPESVLAVIALVETMDPVPTEIMSKFTHVFALTVPDLDTRNQQVQYIIDTKYGSSALGVRIKDVTPLMAGMTYSDMTRLIDSAMYSNTPLLSPILTWPNLSAQLDTYRTHMASVLGTPRIPNVQWSDIGGLEHAKHEILATIQLPLQRPDLFANGMKRRSGILFFGPPGVGKTLVAKAVATECQLNFVSVKGPELINMYVGESEANIRRIFDQARTVAPSIVFFDELDSVAPKRGDKGDAGNVMDRIVAQLLAEMDTLSTLAKPVFVMGATNRPDLLDESLLRPGRFDKLVYLDVPQTHLEQASILTALTRKFPFASDLDLLEVVEGLSFSLTGADLYALASDAMLAALSRHVRKRELGEEEDGGRVLVTSDDFVYASKQLNPSVSLTELARYRQLEAQFSKTGRSGETKIPSKE